MENYVTTTILPRHPSSLLMPNQTEIKGPVTAVPISEGDDLKYTVAFVLILMGPTGSGKSAFIESLVSGSSPGISKDTLESVTQEAICYRMMNLRDGRSGRSVILIDTPGFLDTKISESKVIAMVKDKLNYLRKHTSNILVSMLYFERITDTRLSGSKRKSIALLKAFALTFDVNHIMIITTMWNTLWTPKQIENAERRYSCLQRDLNTTPQTITPEMKLVFPLMIIDKFEFTADSAVSIIQQTSLFHPNDQESHRPTYNSLSLDCILERISNIQQQLYILERDIKITYTPGTKNRKLRKVIQRSEKEAKATLHSLYQELYNFDSGVYQTVFPDAPCPPLPPIIPTSSFFSSSVIVPAAMNWWKNHSGRST
ncbi:hypothetical protein CVT24_008510 [Panaeolus cyanescens]|uniref:AIG1-type G domain-containing protein n=1 Tax=Panaeolus cyanescens TaxID=181874 RepID=A0A409W4D0_9AGAR|nr:hypothetical protein CVT24_008510 [Panaeolus cyanescens]